MEILKGLQKQVWLFEMDLKFYQSILMFLEVFVYICNGNLEHWKQSTQSLYKIILQFQKNVS
jgi:hypothetical protein